MYAVSIVRFVVINLTNFINFFPFLSIPRQIISFCIKAAQFACTNIFSIICPLKLGFFKQNQQYITTPSGTPTHTHTHARRHCKRPSRTFRTRLESKSQIDIGRRTYPAATAYPGCNAQQIYAD